MLKKLIPLAFLIAMFVPIEPVQAVNCKQINRVTVTTIGETFLVHSSRRAQALIDAYKTAFTNANCFSPQDIKDFKGFVNDWAKSCNNPEESMVHEMIFSKEGYRQICKGVKGLLRYTKP